MEVLTPSKVLRRKLEISCDCEEEELTEVQITYYGKAQKEGDDFLAKFKQQFINKPDVTIIRKDQCTYTQYFCDAQLFPIPNIQNENRSLQNSSTNQITTNPVPHNQIFLLNRGLNIGQTVPPLFVTSIPQASINQATPTSLITTTSNSLQSTARLISNPIPTFSSKNQLLQSGGKVVMAKKVPIDTLKRPADRTRPTEEEAKRPKPIETINLQTQVEGIVVDPGNELGQNEENRLGGGRTYPSLVILAKPCFRGVEDDPKHANDKAESEFMLKKVLTFSADKFTEWLIQVGLVRSDHFCSFHKGPDGGQVKFKLGMFTQNQKYVLSGGYVWISDCCPQQFISIFCGSIFENSPFSPQTSLKLIYYWANHATITNVMQWVNVPNIFIKNLYTNLRGVCTAATHEHFGKLGGPGADVQIAVLSLASSKEDGNVGKVKVKILAVFDSAKNIIRMRAIEPLNELDSGNFRKEYSKIFEILPHWIQLQTKILIDDTLDKITLQTLGFYVCDNLVNDGTTEHYPNHQLVNYLRNVIPETFNTTLPVLSRVVLQQFLDELCWREHFGHYPAKAFEYIIKHIIEQTKLTTGAYLVNRLTKISSNPFKDWKYSRWKANCAWRPGGPHRVQVKQVPQVKQKMMKPPTQTITPSVVPHVVTPKVVFNSSGVPKVVNVASPLNPTPSPFSSETALKNIKVISLTPTVPQTPVENDAALAAINDDLCNPNVAKLVIEPYYYGEIPGYRSLQFMNVDLQVPCFACRKLFTCNLSLTDHLISHALNYSATSGDSKELCKCCCKITSSKFLLSQHMSQHHSDIDQYSPKENPKCLICNMMFVNIASLVSHMTKTHHELELPYTCDVCHYQTSIFFEMLKHTKTAHGKDDTLFCPYCFRVTHLLRNGVPSEKNQYNFIYHLRKHQLPLNKKCMKCAIHCMNKTMLMQHETSRHKSCAKNDDVVRYSEEVTYMPAPLSDPIPPKMDRYKISVGGPYKIISKLALTITNSDTNAVCIECEAKISDDHYTHELLCMKCDYSTYCARAINEHFISHHGSSGIHLSHVPTISPRTLYCSCSFSTTDGNAMAQHLVYCKKETAYLAPPDSASNSTLKSLLEEEPTD